MKQNQLAKILSAILALVMIATSLVLPISAVPGASKNAGGGSTVAVNDPEQGVVLVPDEVKKQNSEKVTILVGVADDTIYMQTGDLELAAAGYQAQMDAYAVAEANIEAAVADKIKIDTRYSLLFNGFSFVGEKWMIDAINQIPGLCAFEDFTFALVEGTPTEETVTVSPMMTNSTTNTNAAAAWSMGYSGDGMVVAIIDSGIRKTHEAFSVEPKNPKITREYLQEVYTQYGDKMHGGSIDQVFMMYYNAKLPFCWDYIENDADPQHTYTDHGTHVAGIAAGNNGSDFKGVAPDAQIIPMGVFDENGGATFTTLMAAMEDCVYLGVDAINMSLGVTAFFSAYEALDAYLATVYDALEDAGIAVIAAAGNDATASLWNNYSLYYDKAGPTGLWSMMNIDNGVVGAPSTFPGSLSVASVQNGSSIFGGFTMTYDGDEYEVEPYPNNDLSNLNGTYELVWVYRALPEEVADLDLTGKIALCVRADCTGTEKVANVAARGAIGCIMMNFIPGQGPWYTNDFEGSIPRGVMSYDMGNALVNAMNGSLDTYYAEIPIGVSGMITCKKETNYNSIRPSNFSSWGTTAGLEIKPEVAAPGGAITSAVGFGTNKSYGTWDGTSMATPHVAGGILLIKQSLRQRYPNATASEINEMAYAYLLSTAHGIENVLVRRQGAGMIDLAAAVSSTSYVTVNGGRPKLELDDSKTGEFTMQFEVHNDGTTDKTFGIDVYIMTMGMRNMSFSGYRENYGYNQEEYRIYNQKYHYFLSNDTATNVKVTEGHPFDVTEQCTVTGPTSITVKAGETLKVTLDISCSAGLLNYLQVNAPAGNYLEGFVRLTGGEADLSVPFLGFVGDWDYVPMFDDGFWWQIPYGQTNPAQSSEVQGTFVGYGTMNQGLGLNYYGSMKARTYLPERNAISPNGDGILDAVDTLSFALMRNPKNLKVYLTDEQGNVLETFFDEDYWYRKEYFTSGLNAGTSFSDMEIQYDWSQLEENQTVNLVMEAWLDHEEYDVKDNYNGRMVFPITIDTKGPTVIPEDYPGEDLWCVNIFDDNYLAYYAIYKDEACTQLMEDKVLFDANRNEWSCSFSFDWRENEYPGSVMYVFAADYAGNEIFVQCVGDDVVALDPKTCPASQAYQTREIVGRQMINWNTQNWEYAFVKTNTKDGSQKELLTPVVNSNPMYDAGFGYDFTAAAIRYDGTVFINSFRNLAILNPETYQVTFVAKFFANGALYDPAVRAIMSHPNSGQIYAFAYLCFEDYDGEFYCEVNTTTGELTPVWEIPDYREQAADVWNFGYNYVDADTIAIFGHNGYIWLVKEATGELIREIDMHISAPSGETQFGIHSTGANILFDKTTNEMHIYTRWAWLRHNRYNTGGHIIVDLDDDSVRYTSDGGGMGYVVYGLYFADEVVAKDWYIHLEGAKAAAEEAEAAAVAAEEAAKEAMLMAGECKAAQDAANTANALAAEARAAAEAAKEAVAAAEAAAAANDVKAAAEAEDAAKRAAEDAKAAAEAAFEAAGKVICPSNNFTDVPAGKWFHDAVDFVVSAGLMKGRNDTIFDPAGTLTRGEVVTILYRMAGEPSVEGYENPFTDVPDGKYYTDAVIWAAANGVVTGKTATVFAPKDVITREQLVTIMYRYAGATPVEGNALEGFEDADTVSKYAREAMNWAISNGIVNGMSATKIGPKGTTTRAQIATILMRYMSLD